MSVKINVKKYSVYINKLISFSLQRVVGSKRACKYQWMSDEWSMPCKDIPDLLVLRGLHHLLPHHSLSWQSHLESSACLQWNERYSLISNFFLSVHLYYLKTKTQLFWQINLSYHQINKLTIFLLSRLNNLIMIIIITQLFFSLQKLIWHIVFLSKTNMANC